MKKTLLTKIMLLLCALMVGSSNVWADDYTADFSSNGSPFSANTQSVTITNNNLQATWGISVTWLGSGSYWGNDTNGNQIGASKSGSTERAASKIVISTSNIPGTITSVVVKAASNSSTGTLGVKVGSSSFSVNSSATTTLTGTLTNYTFTGSATGAIEMTFDNSVSGKYFKIASIKVTYSTGSNSDPSISLSSTSIEAPEAGTDGTITVTYNNLTNYDADVIFYEADGTTTPATYDHSWMTAEINASTKNLDYSITANTGAARTAYLRVYALGVEGEVESGLITITQAAKSVAAPTFNLDGGSYMEGVTFTLTSAGNTIYYTTDGSTPTTSSTEYTEPVAIAAGKLTYKAIAVDTYGNKSNVATRTYTGIVPTSLPFSWTGTSSAGKDDLSGKDGVDLSLPSDYAASNAPYRLKFDGTAKYVIIYTDAKPESLSFTAKLFETASSGSKMKIQASTDGLSFTDVEEFTIKGSQNSTFEFTTSNAFAADCRAIKMALSYKDKNVAVGSISVLSTSATLKPAKEYTTLTHAYPLDFTNVEGLKAYIATEVGEGVKMKQVNKVPANTGLVLKATNPGTAVNVPSFDGSEADDVTANKMVGSAIKPTTVVANGGYILKDGAFHPATAGTLGAGKAYLAIPVSESRVLDMSFEEGEATSISEELRIKSEEILSGESVARNATAPYFDLQGRRVANPTKGLYIVNGKLVVVK